MAVDVDVYHKMNKRHSLCHETVHVEPNDESFLFSSSIIAKKIIVPSTDIVVPQLEVSFLIFNVKTPF
jgi:hypothetical protein